ncbi:MAG: gamma-glutamyltransferase [Betaproteobacteria bacterium]|nr:gamma-glutamyltransferase [Betaproteobacteria bacterium]
MPRQRTQNWIVQKPLARSKRGVVASQHRAAAEVGANILAAGGNAVDAAVATGFALGSIEPWNSGLGGIGYMLVYLAREQRVEVVDFGPISPRSLDVRDYPLTGGFTTDLFTWPTVLEDRNVHGPQSIALPGVVDGLGLALERFGSMPLRDVLAPAIALADQGMRIDWFLTLKVATMAADLARYPSTRDIWLPNKLPPVSANASTHHKLSGLAVTLRRLASAGRRDFYEGDIATSIASDLRVLGGNLTRDDLAAYRARIVPPLAANYRDARVFLAPGLTGGASMAETLGELANEKFGSGGPDANAFVAYAKVLRGAYARRLESMGEIKDARDPGCTTHFNVIDHHGNMVAVTQTLLSVFGSKLVLPSTGILMNNGIMWFDPVPGKPNSLAPGKRPLTNMCPVIVRRDNKPSFAIGASGGRKIFPAVLQITSMLIDHGMSLETAFHQPRIDASGGDTVGVDPRLPQTTIDQLRTHVPIEFAEHTVYPTNFACPSAVLDDPLTGERSGIGDVMSPWSGAVGEPARPAVT